MPSLSLSSYRDRALVRFRALVQDTSPSPEMYLSKLRDGKCGGWGLTDTSQCDGDDNDFDYNDLRDCVVLWAVTVPGETEWYRAILNGESLAQSEFPQEDFPIVIKRPAACQYPESLRAHKYPIPRDAHHGAQIKVGFYTSTSRCRSRPQPDVWKLWE
jgi:Mini-chromosome maintenance replisome factor